MASVVVLPEPVTPETRIRPLRKLVSRSASSTGKLAHSKSGIVDGITRKQAADILAVDEVVGTEPVRLSMNVDRQREVGVLLLLKSFRERRRAGRQQQGLQVLLLELRFVERLQDAVHAQHGRVSDDQMQIGRFPIHGQRQPLFQPIGASCFVVCHGVMLQGLQEGVQVSHVGWWPAIEPHPACPQAQAVCRPAVCRPAVCPPAVASRAVPAVICRAACLRTGAPRCCR